MRKFLLLLASLIMTSCSAEKSDPTGPIKVEIERTDAGYRLLRGGKPYVVKGAGMAREDIARFAAAGGNSIRNWSTSNDYQDTQALLDAAHEHGVSVALGLPMIPERSGFDYDDEEAVALQLEAMRKDVLRFKDHPAVLAWLIGNELNHSYKNPKVFNAVNDVALMIKELDPNHPTSTTLAGFQENTISEIKKRAPALDFICLQTYGSLFDLPERMRAANFSAPIMITEWGTLGYWEMETTSWGTPLELTSSEKADVVLRGHVEVISKLRGQLIGSYVFYWGQKQERTPTWFGMLTEAGHLTESVDVMHYIWNDDWPANRTPRVRKMLLDGRDKRQSVTLQEGAAYAASIDAFDYEDDQLTYRWELKLESTAHSEGGDFEAALPNIEGLIENNTTAAISLTAPEPGKYRLFAYAFDGAMNTAHANIPILVKGPESSDSSATTHD